MKYLLIKNILIDNSLFVHRLVDGEIIHTADNYLECRQHIPIDESLFANHDFDLTLCPEKLNKNPYHGGQLDKLILFNDKSSARAYFPDDDKDFQQFGATYTIVIEFTDPKTLFEDLVQEINKTNSEDGSRKYWARHYEMNLSFRFVVFDNDPRTEKNLQSQSSKLGEMVSAKLQLTAPERSYLISRLFDFEGKYSDNPEDDDDDEICWADDAEELIFY